MRKLWFILLLTSLSLMSCQFNFSADEEENAPLVRVERYDQLEYRYLTTGDYSALQEMNTEYPIETRTLIEDILKLGEATDPEINNKFLNFYQDIRLQTLIATVETQFADMDSLNARFNDVFTRLKKMLPSLRIPRIYAQITAFDQSIIVGDHTIGISLDKYLGENYLGYKTYYPLEQRKLMTREYIIPDCVIFYLLSQYPLQHFESRTQQERDLHMARIQWVANQSMESHFFKGRNIDIVSNYMKKNHKMSAEDFLRMDDINALLGK